MMVVMDKKKKETDELTDELNLTRLNQWSELAMNFLSMTTKMTLNDLKEVCCWYYAVKALTNHLIARFLEA
jgi:hypothetical protein